MGTKYSPTELKAHRDQWWEHCASNPDEPLGLFLDVGFKAISRTATVHRYRLIATYKNTLKEAQDGWKLTICFPAFLPLFPNDYDRYEIREEDTPYIQLKSSSSSRVYPGESIEVVSRDVHFIEYEVNDDIFHRLRLEDKVLWQFFTPNAPVIAGEKPLMELQDF